MLIHTLIFFKAIGFSLEIDVIANQYKLGNIKVLKREIRKIINHHFFII